MLRAKDVIRIHQGHYTVPVDSACASPAGRGDRGHLARALLAWRLDRDGQPHPPYAPWVARLQELDPWRVTFAHDLAIWERGV